MTPVTQQAHELLTALVRGNLAIDATAGNGHDTAFLANLVGPTGTVWAFDIQAAALQRTASRLRERSISVDLRLRSANGASPVAPQGPADAHRPRVICVEASHTDMGSHLPTASRGQIAAIMFNLGYLPGSDQSCITTTATTLIALGAAIDGLAPGGVLTVVVYPGHPGGREEATAVREWFIRQTNDGTAELLREMTPPLNPGPQLFALRRCGTVIEQRLSAPSPSGCRT